MPIASIPCIAQRPDGPQICSPKFALPAGFPANTIRGIRADQSGFIWIFCSNNRFYRFDGQEMLSATALFGSKINQYVINAPYIDQYNNLWIGNLDNCVVLTCKPLNNTTTR